MAESAFAMAIFLTIAILLGRRWRRRRQRQAVLDQPGRRPKSALRVSRFDEIDAAVSAARCYCGGRLSTLSEGSRPTDTGSVRVVHCECLLCEEEVDLFFELFDVLH